MKLKSLHEGIAKRTYTKARITPVSRTYQFVMGDDLDWQMSATVVARLLTALNGGDRNPNADDPNFIKVWREALGDQGSVLIRVPDNITKRHIEQVIDDVVTSTKYDYKNYQG